MTTAGVAKREGARRVKLRRRLATVLIWVTLGSVLLLGIVNYLQAGALLSRQVLVGLTAQGTSLAKEIESALTSIQSTAATVSGGPMLASDLQAFSTGFQDLSEHTGLVTTEVRDALRAYYESSLIPKIEEAGLSVPSVDDLLPVSDAGLYLQYRYLVQGDTAGQMDTADDAASSYAEAYAERNPRLTGLASTLGYTRMMLIDASGTVVYSTDVKPDLGTSLGAGPYAKTGLATVVNDRLPTTAPGDAVFSDFEFYLPEEGRPTMFAVVALRSGGQSAGAVAFEIPIEALNQLATAGGRWQEVGLGKTGEVYIVGPDGLMRSESRRWLEDPDGYLSQLRADPSTVGLADRISALRTTVLIQPVDSPVVADALDGVTGTSRTTDYLGRRSLAFATPIESEGLGWAVVAEISDAEAGASLRSFRNRLLVVAAFLLPIAGLLGFLIADRFTRPIGPVVEAAQSIAEGDLDTSLPDLGSNELGDVARRLEDMAAHLRDQEEQLAAEEQEITRMLLAALPARLVERLRSGDRRIEDLVDSATVISVTITGVFDQPDVNPELAVELGTRISSGLETAADDLGIERVRSSSAHHLFVSGLDAPGPEADAAVNFALAAQDVVTSQGESDAVEVGFHAGLAAGRIVSGLVPGDYLSYGVFGEAVHLALTLDASASDGEILAHRSVVSAVEDDWAMEPARELVDLSGSALEASRVAGRADDLAGRVE